MPIPITPEVTLGPQMSRIDRTLSRLPANAYRPLAELTVEAWTTPEPVPYAKRESGEHKTLAVGDVWGKLWDCGWFHLTGTVPAEAAGLDIVLLIDVSGEALVVDENGLPVQGLTSLSSSFDYSLGRPGKHVFPLANPSLGGETIDLWMDAGTNDLFGVLQNGGTLKEAQIAVRQPETLALCYDCDVLRGLLDHVPAQSARHAQVRQALYDAALILNTITEETAKAARARLAPELAKQGGDPSLTISAVGHAHIDLAWLWPLRETIRKGARTFATALRMMERYPDYVFGASQPQLFQWMKDFYPSLYAQIKERVAEGRWEVQGGMWVEPDANVPSGEALVRQILYGKRFFRAEFGVDVQSLWMPDVFGYSGSLPQIIAQAGMPYFMTQKLSWSEFNVHPHHTFQWEGIDGSRVLVHMPPEGTYNSSAAPLALARAEENYLDKAVSDRVLVLFGIGDGGGGPGEEHLERLAREHNLSGLPPVVQEPSSVFFERLNVNADKYAVWRGELYLEKHQGTLTTQARNKRANRTLEIALRECELSCVRAGEAYPTEALDRIWKEMLLLQFHDILPGSSITRVYDESLPRYAALLAEVAALTAAADLIWLGEGTALTATNSLSWPRREWVQAGGQWYAAEVPALAAARLPDAPADDFAPPTASETLLENEHLRAEFAGNGDLISVYDKDNSREVLRPGEIGNALAVYTDGGDAWDFAPDYAEVAPAPCPVTASEAWTDGPCAALRQTRKFGDSTLTQTITLLSGSRQLTFQTHADWRENGKMLRTSFPVAVLADTARCEIQFGNIARPTTRNTTWDAAKDEVCGHKWVDLSERGYGVALLNDCKYGHKVHGTVLDLNLLRSTGGPDPVADRAEHEFTYALLPHAGDYAEGGVVRAAYELNMPLRVVSASSSSALSGSLLTVSAENVIVEAVKKAEDSDALIVRLYESHAASARVTVQFGSPIASAARVDLLEENDAPLTVTENMMVLDMKPFEIVTLKVKAG